MAKSLRTKKKTGAENIKHIAWRSIKVIMIEQRGFKQQSILLRPEQHHMSKRNLYRVYGS